VFVFPAPVAPSVAVAGDARRFPVHRVYCVARNYADHAREMGAAVERERPVFFQKPADAVVDSGGVIPYPPGTGNLHHEVELVVALGSGGSAVPAASAPERVFGYAVGLDLTRRDLQRLAKHEGLPWDAGKAFDHSAPLSAITPAPRCGHPSSGELWLEVNGEPRQRGDIASMLFSVPEIIAELSKLFELRAGDLIFTGTPAGVAPLLRGDHFRAGLDGLATLDGTIV